jgi:16S rRNA G527 N7-methylase RsmG
VGPTVDTNATLNNLGARYRLSAEQLTRLAKVLRGLAADELAPTTVTEPSQAIDVHLADSLAALDLAAVREANDIVDIGARG